MRKLVIAPKVDPAKAIEQLARSSGERWTGERRISPNDLCPCGSKKKFKKCCFSKGIELPKEPVKNLHAEEAPEKEIPDELFQKLADLPCKTPDVADPADDDL